MSESKCRTCPTGPSRRRTGDGGAPAEEPTQGAPDTNYGHEIAVKTSRGYIFILSVPLPYAEDDGEQDKFSSAINGLENPDSPQSRYMRSILSVLESVQTFMYYGSTVPQGEAHAYASIAWNPPAQPYPLPSRGRLRMRQGRRRKKRKINRLPSRNPHAKRGIQPRPPEADSRSHRPAFDRNQ